MFQQMEGFVIDHDINVGHLKGTLIDFCRHFFGIDNLPVRLRPSFFPFTEPSFEVDIGCDKNRKIGNGGHWMEILGCGMIHPNVIQNIGLNPNHFQGFAFGMGMERLAMLKYGVTDIRSFVSGDIRFSEAFAS
jgi:phenylalanyl-tRNA synthetase alpha chain